MHVVQGVLPQCLFESYEEIPGVSTLKFPTPRKGGLESV